MLQELVDRFVTTKRLVLFQLHGPVDHRLLYFAWLAAVAPPLAKQCLEASHAIQLPLPPQGGAAGLSALAIGEKVLGIGQGAQKLPSLLRRNLVANQRLQQRTPENGPLLVAIGPVRHGADSPFRTFCRTKERLAHRQPQPVANRGKIRFFIRCSNTASTNSNRPACSSVLRRASLRCFSGSMGIISRCKPWPGHVWLIS